MPFPAALAAFGSTLLGGVASGIASGISHRIASGFGAPYDSGAGASVYGANLGYMGSAAQLQAAQEDVALGRKDAWDARADAAWERERDREVQLEIARIQAAAQTANLRLQRERLYNELGLQDWRLSQGLGDRIGSDLFGRGDWDAIKEAAYRKWLIHRDNAVDWFSGLRERF